MTKWHAFRQIGNSLPPLLARAVGSQIVAAMGITPERATEALALGDVSLLRLATRDAAGHFGVDIEAVPSHKLRHRTKTGASAKEPAVDRGRRRPDQRPRRTHQPPIHATTLPQRPRRWSSSAFSFSPCGWKFKVCQVEDDLGRTQHRRKAGIPRGRVSSKGLVPLRCSTARAIDRSAYALALAG